VFSFGIGSGNGLWPKSSGAMGIFLVTLLLGLYEFKDKSPKFSSKLLSSVAFLISSLYIFSFYWLIMNPYRQAPLSEQTQKVNIASHGALKLAPNIAGDIQLFLESLKLSGFKRTDRLLNLTGLSNSHLQLLSQSKPPKMIFLFERSFPNAENVLRQNLSRDPGLKDKSYPWLILPIHDNQGLVSRSSIEKILTENGIIVSTCYKEIYGSKLGYSIWKPVCVSKREELK
jgi:hypothetical protein